MSRSSAKPARASSHDKRHGLRTQVPSIDLRVEGERQVCGDWGLGGCRIANYTGDLHPGDTTVVEVFLRIPLPHKGLPVKAEVLRRDEGGLALRFDTLTADDFTDFCRSVEEELRQNSKHDA